MIVVGTSLLASFCARHPVAAGPLRALNALLAHADWAAPDDIRRDCGALMAMVDGAVVLDLDQVRVTLKVNHALGVVRIAGVEEISP